MSFLIPFLYVLLVPLSIFLVLVVLMQKSKSDGGVGAALGGGMTEATFGADTGNVLATITRNGTIAFFVLCFGLYLAQIAHHRGVASKVSLPVIEAPAATPAAPSAPSAAESPAVTMPAVTVPAVTPAPAQPAK